MMLTGKTPNYGDRNFLSVNLFTSSHSGQAAEPTSTLQEPRRRTAWAMVRLLNFLGAFVKFRKAAISFVMSVRLFARLHGITRPPLDGFS